MARSTPLFSSRGGLPPPSPAPPCPEELKVDPEQMATQTLEYMNKFEQHAEAIRKHLREECHHAYRTLLSQGRALPLESKWPHCNRRYKVPLFFPYFSLFSLDLYTWFRI
jgi:hypothetical protein